MAPPVAGYYAWYDASQISGVADGTVVSTWADLSGNSRDLTAHTGTPTYYKTTTAKLINNNPTVYFNADGHMSTGATWSLAQPFTIFAIGQLSTVTAPAKGMYGRSDGSLFLRALSGTVWEMNGGASLTGGTQNTALHYFTCQFNGASSLFRVDGTQVTTGSGSVDINGYNFYVGEDGASHYWTGPVGEVIVYPSALSTANMQSVESYLTRWNSPMTPSGTATLNLGPLTVVSTGVNTLTGTASLSLGPLTLSATGTASYPSGTVALPLGPLALSSTSINIPVPLISLGPLTTTITGTVSAGGGVLSRAFVSFVRPR